MTKERIVVNVEFALCAMGSFEADDQTLLNPRKNLAVIVASSCVSDTMLYQVPNRHRPGGKSKSKVTAGGATDFSFSYVAYTHSRQTDRATEQTEQTATHRQNRPLRQNHPLRFWLVLTVVAIDDLWLYLHVGYKLRSLESGSDY